jgi:hypothetical protein
MGEDIELELHRQMFLAWAEFLLNPRRLRGSDFLMRWSQGVWSEERLIQAISQTGTYFALPYGPSGVAPDHDVRAFELYFERLEKAGLGQLKRPDLLIFRQSDRAVIEAMVQQVGGIEELRFIPETELQSLLAKAVIAVECENSLWKAKQKPNYGAELKPQRRLNGQPGLRKSAVVPTVIIKAEDCEPLQAWQNQAGIPIHIWHVFYDMAFGLSFDAAQQLIENGTIEGTVQIFQAPGGATTRKTIYKFYYHYAYSLGQAATEPTLVAEHIIDKNGHILPYVRFESGNLTISPEAVQILDSVSRGRS